jgi:hypothetical protein
MEQQDGFEPAHTRGMSRVVEQASHCIKALTTMQRKQAVAHCQANNKEMSNAVGEPT